MHDKGERCFYLNSGKDHSSDTHKVITPAGIATYFAHCTFGYRSQAFQGEVSTWRPLRGRGRLRRLHRERHSDDIFTRRGYSRCDTGGVNSSTWGEHFYHVFIGSGGGGGGILDIFARGGCSSRVFIGTGTGGVGSSTGGGIPPMTSSGATATSAAAVTSSRGGGIPAAVPAAEVTGGPHVSGSGVGSPAVVRA